MEKFDIRIKDDFLKSSKFKFLYDRVPFYNYHANGKEECEKQFNIKLKTHFCSVTMLATVEPVVHCDYDKEKCSHQVIVYIRGNEDLHKGTGFYTTKNNINELNTHVGFKENRAIFWNSEIFHSPLNWSADNKSKRFSLIAQYKEIK